MILCWFRVYLVFKIWDFLLICQIRVLCGVEHTDLKQLMLVSKSVMEAVSSFSLTISISSFLIWHWFSDEFSDFHIQQALVAKRLHFAYRTPTKVKAFKNNIEIDDDLSEELEAPGAPIQSRKCRRRIVSMSEEEFVSFSHYLTDNEFDATENWALITLLSVCMYRDLSSSYRRIRARLLLKLPWVC